LTRVILRRLVEAVPLLLAVSFVVFALLQLAPGGPEYVLAGGHTVSPATLAALRNEFHLNQPFLAQYWIWLTGVLHGNLGQSIVFHDTVLDVIAPRILPTLELAAYALVLILVGGFSLGVLAALRARRWTGHAASGAMLVSSTVSPYVSGILLITVFAVQLSWFPIFGSGSGLWGRIYHLTLPACAMAISLTALVGRTCQVSLADALNEPYVDAARSRGYSTARVIVRHALRNALLPVITVSGVVFGYVIVAAVLVEYTFGLNGLGSLLVQAVEDKDFPTVQGVTLLFAGAFVVINLVVDLLYALLDPRVRGAWHR
jgi:peptide/nickel transport system permease protein